MKSLSIIVPVKELTEGKSRLSSALSAQARCELNRFLLNHTLEQVMELADIADIYVISKSSEILAEAERRDLIGCSEGSSCDLNGAIALGMKRAHDAGATELMVIPVDIPSLASKRMRAIIDEYHGTSDVMIITDRTGDGTNVMLWRPIETASFQYGIGSASRHAEICQKSGSSRHDAKRRFSVVRSRYGG